MTATNVAAPAPAHNVGPSKANAKERRWSSNGKRDPIARIAAKVIGLTPVSTEHVMREVNHRVAAIVHAFKQLGDEERLTRFMEPIQRALEGREPPPNVAATWTAAEHAEAMESVAQVRYLCDKSDKNLAALIRETRAEIRFQTAKLDMLLAEQRQRERA